VALICVIDPSLAAAPESGYPASELIALARKDARRLLAELGQRASVKSAPVEFIPVGKPPAEIVKEAKEWPADLIVIGSHGRRGIQRFLLGSVAEAVVRHAPCPVLVVPGEE
jgi:nucleotide-binding universal stress UspA family protein